MLLMQKAHGINDYWQLSCETLALKTGDCEDYAILLVSMLRAYGVPDDEVYVAIGYDASGECHAWVIERYYSGVWRLVDAESATGFSYIGATDGRIYDISYCFNDASGFHGLPGYPDGYVAPDIPATHAEPKPQYDWVRLKAAQPTGWFEGDINLNDPSYDAILDRMGKLWVPSYTPPNYYLYHSTVNGNWGIHLSYKKDGASAILWIDEWRNDVAFRYPSGTVQKIKVNGYDAFLVKGAWWGSLANPFEIWDESAQLSLYFNIDGWVIGVSGLKTENWTEEELIKIAESLSLYH